MMSNPPQAILQNHPTKRNVIVKNWAIPTRKFTTRVTNFRPSCNHFSSFEWRSKLNLHVDTWLTHTESQDTRKYCSWRIMKCMFTFMDSSNLIQESQYWEIDRQEQRERAEREWLHALLLCHWWGDSPERARCIWFVQAMMYFISILRLFHCMSLFLCCQNNPRNVETRTLKISSFRFEMKMVLTSAFDWRIPSLLP